MSDKCMIGTYSWVSTEKLDKYIHFIGIGVRGCTGYTTVE